MQKYGLALLLALSAGRPPVSRSGCSPSGGRWAADRQRLWARAWDIATLAGRPRPTLAAMALLFRLVPPPPPAGVVVAGLRRHGVGRALVPRHRSASGCSSPPAVVRRDLRSAGRHRGPAPVGAAVGDRPVPGRRGGGPARGRAGRGRGAAGPREGRRVGAGRAAPRPRVEVGERCDPHDDPSDDRTDAGPADARRRDRRPRHRGQPHRGAPQRRRDLPRHARGHRRRRAHDRLPHLRLLGGRDRDQFRRDARRPSQGGRPGAGPARRLGRRPMDPTLIASWRTPACTCGGSGRCDGCAPASSTTAPTARC